MAPDPSAWTDLAIPRSAGWRRRLRRGRSIEIVLEERSGSCSGPLSWLHHHTSGEPQGKSCPIEKRPILDRSQRSMNGWSEWRGAGVIPVGQTTMRSPSSPEAISPRRAVVGGPHRLSVHATTFGTGSSESATTVGPLDPMPRRVGPSGLLHRSLRMITYDLPLAVRRASWTGSDSSVPG